MAIIGTFTKTDNKFVGEIETLSLKAELKIIPTGLEGENNPNFRVMTGNSEIGAGWTRLSKKGNDYISLKLDDPIFGASFYASLVEREDKHVLIWSPQKTVKAA